MEYKFRGRRIDTGEWVYGHHIEIRTAEGRTGHFIITDDESKVDHDIPPMGIMFTLNENIFMINPDTLGQFSGFRDTLAREIYDGDLLVPEKNPLVGTYSMNQDKGVKIAQVAWSRDYSRFFIGAYGYPKSDERNLGESRVFDMCEDVIDGFGFHIAGNVYENGDLISK